MAKTLTKEDLQKLGVTDVHRDGTVYVHGTKKAPTTITSKKKYGTDCTYLAIALQDYSRKIATTQKVRRKSGKLYVAPAWAYAVRTIPLGRLVYAWFHGTVPGDLDVDHIDGDKMNNHIDNLQAITRRENLAKRTLSWEEISRIYRAKEREMKERNKND